MRRLIFLDTETTGLDPEVHEILELALVAEDGSVLLHTRVRPERLEQADPRALEVNGYSAEGWADAPAWADVAPRVAELLRGAVAVGHNVAFDAEMLRAGLKRVDPELAGGVCHYRLDTLVLALEHLAPVGLERFNLGAVCDFLGVELKDAHTALADTLAARAVYRKLARAGWLRRLGWRLRSWTRG